MFYKVKERCRKGIPQSVRSRAWQYLCGSKFLMENNKGRFEVHNITAENVLESLNSFISEFIEEHLLMIYWLFWHLDFTQNTNIDALPGIFK